MIDAPKIRQITILPARGGYVVTVGCQTFVFTSDSELLTELGGYLDDPEKMEKQYATAYEQMPEGGPMPLRSVSASRLGPVSMFAGGV